MALTAAQKRKLPKALQEAIMRKRKGKKKKNGKKKKRSRG